MSSSATSRTYELCGRAVVRLIAIVIVLIPVYWCLRLVSSGLDELPLVCWDEEQLAEAQLAYEGKVAQYGLQDARVLPALEWLAECAGLVANDWAKAFELHRQGWSISSEVYGLHDPKTLSYLEEVARYYIRVEMPEEAQRILGLVLESRETHQPQQQLEIAAVLQQLGRSFLQQQRYDEAEGALRRAVAIRDALLPANDPEHSYSLAFLGSSYQSRGELAQAIQCYQRVVANNPPSPFWRRFLGEKPSRQLEFFFVFRSLAAIYLEQGRYGEARPLLERLVTYRPSLRYVYDASLVVDLSDLAEIYLAEGQIRQARRLLRRAQKLKIIGRQVLSPREEASLAKLPRLYQEAGLSAEYQSWESWVLAPYAGAEKIVQRAEQLLGAWIRPTMIFSLEYLLFPTVILLTALLLFKALAGAWRRWDALGDLVFGSQQYQSQLTLEGRVLSGAIEGEQFYIYHEDEGGNTTLLRREIAMVRESAVRFSVRRRSLSERLFHKADGLREVRLGWPDLDESYQIRVEDSPAGERLISQPEFLKLLRTLMSLQDFREFYSSSEPKYGWQKAGLGLWCVGLGGSVYFREPAGVQQVCQLLLRARGI